ncbi:MAG: alpha/beta hydrolase [Scytonema sp. PMC 1069.18]|nr:alpha/beta hydrolase [Scytonema sp. PMC 1069.18]MEC4887790.1 alpha/beta hydrolase [Scytonema sp. PMC 1070.18]
MDSLFLNSRRKLTHGLLFWREVGNGTPVILLHGSWNDSSQWVAVMESLSHDVHCFAPDLLGFGETEYPNIHYSIDLQVECLAEFLTALKLQRVYLVGHSLGGWIASSYAFKYPEKVYGLVLLAPEGVTTTGYKKHIQRMQSLAKMSPTVLKWLRMLRPLTKIFGWDEKIEQDYQLRQLMLQYPTACQLLFQRQLPEIEAELVDEQLYLLPLPVLILQGGKDTQEAQDRTQAYAQSIPQANVKIIERGGSDLPQSCAGVVANDIRDFVKSGGGV